MAVMNIQWNNCGSVLAVAGMQRAAGQVNDYQMLEINICFYMYCKLVDVLTHSTKPPS